MSAQLYLIAPIIFIPILRYPKYGFLICIFIILISPISIITPALFLALPTYLESSKFPTLTNSIRSFYHYHSYPLQYVTSFCVGILTGYLIAARPKAKIIGGKFGIALLSILCLACVGIVWAWNYAIWDKNYRAEALGWFVGYKFLFPVALGTVSFVFCTRGMLHCNDFM